MIYASELAYKEGGYFEIPVGTGVASSVSEIVDYIWDVTGCKSVVNKGAVPMHDKELDCIADKSRMEELVQYCLSIDE